MRVTSLPRGLPRLSVVCRHHYPCAPERRLLLLYLHRGGLRGRKRRCTAAAFASAAAAPPAPIATGGAGAGLTPPPPPPPPPPAFPSPPLPRPPRGAWGGTAGSAGAVVGSVGGGAGAPNSKSASGARRRVRLHSSSHSPLTTYTWRPALRASFVLGVLSKAEHTCVTPSQKSAR